MNTAAIVNYCTNDFRFLDDCLFPLKKLFSQIIVPVCTHFFDGAAEDQLLLNYSFAKHPDVLFVLFAFDEKLYGLSDIPHDKNQRIHYWHSTARYVGYHFLKDEIEGALFIDVDEIIDLPRFRTNFNYDALRFDSYFYMREAGNRAKTHTANALYVKRRGFHPDHLLLVGERMGTYERISGEKKWGVCGEDGQPLFHHYSWVRAQSELMKKVVSWGHHSEKNWTGLLEKELALPLRATDLLYGLDYERVERYIDPLRVCMEEERQKAQDFAYLQTTDFPNVVMVDRESILRRHFNLFY